MRRGYYNDPRLGGGLFRQRLEEATYLAAGNCRHGAHPEKCKTCLNEEKKS